MVHLLGYHPSLDGLRALAALAVLGYHFSPFGADPGGWLGVDLFFAMSGFLITGLLIKERANSGGVSLVRFHIRRALRVWPALWLFLGVWGLAMLIFHQQPWFSTVPSLPVNPHGSLAVNVGLHGIEAAAAQVYNWLSVAGVHLPPLGQVWSLSVEEQFYLLWPLILLAVWRYRPRLTIGVTLGLAAVSALECVYLFHSGAGSDRVYFGTDTRAQALLLGAAGAQLWSSGRLDRVLRSQLVPIAMAGAGGVLVFFAMTHHSGVRGAGGLSAIDMSAAVLVLGLVGRPGWAARALSIRPLVYIGRRSYAIYLWSYVFATWFRLLGNLGIILGISATFITAEVSWRLVEHRALTLKSRWAAEQVTPPVLEGSARDYRRSGVAGVAPLGSWVGVKGD